MLMIDIEKYDDETQALVRKSILEGDQIDTDVDAMIEEIQAYIICAKDNIQKDPAFYVMLRRVLEILPNIKSIRRFISVVNMKKKVNCYDDSD